MVAVGSVTVPVVGVVRVIAVGDRFVPAAAAVRVGVPGVDVVSGSGHCSSLL
jgi:hypothetical protein